MHEVSSPNRCSYHINDEHDPLTSYKRKPEALIIFTRHLIRIFLLCSSLRNDKAWCAGLRHWRLEWGRRKGWLLEDGDSEHRPPPQRKAPLPHGSRVSLTSSETVLFHYSQVVVVNCLFMCFSYAVDLVVCVALGCDMFDCVFPTRTAVSDGLSVDITFYRSTIQRFGSVRTLLCSPTLHLFDQITVILWNIITI